MYQTIRSALLLIVVALGFAACAGTPPAHELRRPALSAVDEPALADSVKVMATDLLATWSRLDPDAYLALFSEDVGFYERGKRLTRADLEAAVRRGTTRLREIGWEAKITGGPYVEVLGPDAAVATFLYQARIGGNTRDARDLAAAWTLVYERRNGEWRVVQAHESFVPAGGS